MQLGSTFRNLPPVTKNLLVVNAIIWVALQFFPASALNKFDSICALHYFTSQDFNPVQLITYMFVHHNFMHLFFNMFALFMFGMVIERVLGPKRFLFYYLSCGLGAALIQEGVFAIMISNLAGHMPEGAMSVIIENGRALMESGYNYGGYMGEVNELVNATVIGASGAIFGILLAFGFIFPRQPLYLMFIPVPVQARWFVLGYGVIELLQGIGNSSGDNVAHFAHLGGMVLGILMLLYWKKKGIINVRNF